MILNKTEALKIEIRNKLKTLLSNVTYIYAPIKKKYPYAVFEISELSSVAGRTLCELEINIVDMGNASNVIDDLADNTQKLLNEEVITSEAIQFVLYKKSNQNVQEENPELMRRRLIFELHMYERI